METENLQCRRNRLAWDKLYGSTSESVWGTDPVPFVEEFVALCAAEFTRQSRLLDAATGEGRHLPLLLNQPGKVFATDAAPSAIQKLQQIPGEFQSVCCELRELPWDDDEVDFALLIDTIETLPEPSGVLTELHRVLKPGGLLLCNIPGEEDGISGIDMHEGEQGALLYKGSYYFRFYSEEEALALIHGSGFEVVQNEIRSWQEQPHPGFRDHEHSHTSRIFLLRKPGTPDLRTFGID